MSDRLGLPGGEGSDYAVEKSAPSAWYIKTLQTLRLSLYPLILNSNTAAAY